MLEKKIEILNKIEYWLENEDLFWEWMSSVVDEKLENTNENSAIQSIPNDLFDLDEFQVNNLLKAKIDLEQVLKYLKNYTKLMKQTISSENIEEKLSSLTIDHNETIKKYQNDLEVEFKKIIASENLIDNSSPGLLFNIDLFEQRLILINKTNKDNKTNKALKLETIQQHISLVENKIKLLSTLHDENRKLTLKQIENFINQLNDCYAIFF